jgi:ABC-2 type transport system ATP-binding protein
VPSQIAVAQGLTKSYAPDAGVFDLDLEIPAGQIVGFIGPSGSGKTTTVRMMTGLTKPDSGSIEVFGETPTEFASNTRARIGYMPQHTLLYPDLTLSQNLEFTASLYGVSRKTSSRLDDLVGFLDLEGAMSRLPEQASGGEQRRLMLAATLVHAPDLLFMDEPTAGIDPVLRRKIWDGLADISERGATLFVTTQYVGEAAYCDYVAVLAEGRMLTLDTPEGLRRNAYGGELLDVVFAQHPGSQILSSLEQATSASRVDRIDETTVRLVVEDAGTAGPAVNEWSRANQVEVVETEAYVPSFDDVFVELVDRLSNGQTPPADRPDTEPADAESG